MKTILALLFLLNTTTIGVMNNNRYPYMFWNNNQIDEIPIAIMDNDIDFGMAKRMYKTS